jgi:uncharacterized protein
MARDAEQADLVAVVRGMYEGFARGDIPAVLEVMHPDVEWVESAAESFPHQGTHVGRAAIGEHVFSNVDDYWSEFAIVPQEYFRDGDTVIVRGVVRAVAKDTGRAMNAPYVHVFTFANGKLTRYTDHQDTAMWAEALAPAPSPA